MITEQPRRRSVGFLERDGDTWACFLVTFRGDGGRWHGYFSFRPKDGDLQDDEIRTADIFLEPSESEIDQKARGLGRPLLSGLLASALHTAEGAREGSPELRRWFRRMLAQDSRELRDEWESRAPRSRDDGDEEPARLRSLYESYRLDQVAHLIALLRPDAFRATVDTILDGRAIDFRAKDRLQFAMLVVERLEALLPLPPFEAWAEDYLAHQEAYRLYTHTLHREGRLP